MREGGRPIHHGPDTLLIGLAWRMLPDWRRRCRPPDLSRLASEDCVRSPPKFGGNPRRAMSAPLEGGVRAWWEGSERGSEGRWRSRTVAVPVRVIARPDGSATPTASLRG